MQSLKRSALDKLQAACRIRTCSFFERLHRGLDVTDLDHQDHIADGERIDDRRHRSRSRTQANPPRITELSDGVSR